MGTHVPHTQSMVYKGHKTSNTHDAAVRAGDERDWVLFLVGKKKSPVSTPGNHQGNLEFHFQEIQVRERADGPTNG